LGGAGGLGGFGGKGFGGAGGAGGTVIDFGVAKAIDQRLTERTLVTQ